MNKYWETLRRAIQFRLHKLHPLTHKLHWYFREAVDVLVVISIFVMTLGSFVLIGLSERGDNQANAEASGLFVWTPGSIQSQYVEEDSVQTLIQNDEGLYITANPAGDVVTIAGRLPEFELIEAYEVGGEIRMLINSYTQDSIQDCAYIENQLYTEKVVEFEKDVPISRFLERQDVISNLSVILMPTLRPELGQSVQDCIDSAYQRTVELGQNPTQLRVLVDSIRNTPQSLKIDGIPEELLGFVKDFRICPCDDYTDIPGGQQELLTQLLEDADGNDYVDLTAIFQLRQDLSVPQGQVSLDNLNPESIQNALVSYQDAYIAYLNTVDSINGTDIPTLVAQYEQKKEQERLALSNSRSAASGGAFVASPSNVSSNPVNNVSNQPAGAASGGCGGSDASLSQLYCLINEYRVAQGRGTLSASGGMQTAAANHNNWMVSTGSFSHTGANGSRFWDRCGSVGVACSSEIIARTSITSAALCMQAWKASPDHNGALLNASYSSMGGAINGGFCTLVLN